MKDTRKTGGPRKPGGAAGKPPRGDKPFRKDGPRKDGPRTDRPRTEGSRPGESRTDGPRKTFSSKPKAAPKANPDHLTVTGEGERISKVMARAGVASRRDCERMIMEGRVSLNGKVLESPAVNVTDKDRVEVDGQVIGAIERTRLWIYYKPAGLVTTNFDPEGRPTVFDNLPEELPRVISVGRLDINTEGLLLLTNDGGLARMLELPSTGWLRRYRVRAYGAIDQARLDELREGIAVDGVLYGAIEATLDREQGHNVWITMGLREGKNREIKNVLGAIGLEVNRLIRISYGPFQLGELEDGQVVEVKSRTLREQLGPRLIEEANANFEAPIFNAPPEAKEEAPATREWAAGERPRRESREDRRERDLARIDTKKPERGFSKDRGEGRDRDGSRDRGERGDRGERRGARDDRGKDDKKQKRLPLGSSRTANVWMAPGARPVAPKKAKAKPEDVTAEAGPKRRVLRLKTDGVETSEGPVRKARSDRPERAERPAKPFGSKPREDRADGDRPTRARPARSFSEDRPSSDRPKRPFAGKPREERTDGERPVRAARPARSFNDDRSAGEDRPKRAFGGKPRGVDGARTDKPRSSAPRAEGARSERPRSDKPRTDRPRSDGPRSDKPRGDGPRKGPAGGSKGPGRGADRRR
jgi:23S rRNA pseudouridine2605 synthase